MGSGIEKTLNGADGVSIQLQGVRDSSFFLDARHSGRCEGLGPCEEGSNNRSLVGQWMVRVVVKVLVCVCRLSIHSC